MVNGGWTFACTLKLQVSKTGFDGHQARLLKDFLAGIVEQLT